MTDSKLFAVDNLAVFERHGAEVKQSRGGVGAHVILSNGWTLSVQWGAGTYSTNHGVWIHPDTVVDDAVTAEIAVWRGGDGMVEWADGDTVQGWCSMERVQKILDLLAEDRLVADGVADDSRSEVAS